ncbi:MULTISPECIES: OprO/OprP family phosphate-selective porin [Luteimonas]|uniref:OprO/OprP family phosphate-selective porin n=1 Tax=Luteimonas TaxID=83614 RepID=UPI001304053D|nr:MULTISPECIES: porin [Luteimonas]
MHKTPLALVLALGAGLAPGAAASSERSELAELKAQLAALQAKVDALEQRAAQDEATAATVAPPSPVIAPAPAPPVTPAPAAADAPKVATRGGLRVESADGEFEASLSGRIHFDAYAFDRDQADTTGTTDFRRARLTLAGLAYGWEYKLEQDFAAGSNLDGLRDAFIATDLWGGTLTIGHFKPYRSMEELTSSNDILMMERPFASATGLFNGRQFQQGVGYRRAGDHYTAGFTVFNLRGASGTRNEGVGASGRVTWAPIATDTETLHFGGWASVENANQGSADLAASASYAGRRGPSQSIATVAGDSGGKVTAAGVEAAGTFGPLFFQAEYVDATFEQPIGGDQDVMTWYLQGSWLLNGGHHAYKPATGVFGAPRATDRGLWELTGRYDVIENRDLGDREVSSVIVGLNYYLNPSLRFMFNYVRGDNHVNGDKTAQYALRTQFSW